MGSLPDARVPSVRVRLTQESRTRKEQSEMPRYVVERAFRNGLGIPAGAEGTQSCLEIIERNADAGVTWLHSYVNEHLKNSLCVYAGASHEAIAKIASRNHLPVEGINEVL